MIDLETLGLHPAKAPLLQIAIEPFHLFEDGPSTKVPPFQATVNVASCVLTPFNRVIDPGTVAWWAKTDPVLLVQLMESRTGVSLSSALGSMAMWFDTWFDHNTVIDGVWAKGPTFDVVMLEMALEQEGMKVPWKYNVIRDVRTMEMIAGDDDACWNGGKITEIEREGKAHDARVDCLRQIRVVQQTWQRRVKHDVVV